ncbi:MAG: tetratricopeptide repeat protein [Armatimonadetes bacterium]|nr:tetratricopeptide repeat protein [Armatimonadota bacterium]
MELVGKWFGFGRNENYDAGVRAFDASEYEVAVEQFKICLASDPDVSTRERAKNYMAGSLGKLAKQEVASGDWTRALHFLDDAVSLRPAYADLRMLRALVFDRLGRLEDREWEISFSLSMNPRYGLAVLYDGIGALELGKKEEGLKRVREAATCDPRLASPEYEAAVQAVEQGDLAAAIDALKAVQPIQTVDAEDIAREADELAHQGRYRDAEERFRRALEISPRFADVRCKHGQALMQIDEIEQAIAEFREAISINDRYADAYAYLGVSLKRSGQNEDAMVAFRTALEIDPSHAVAQQEVERTL